MLPEDAGRLLWRCLPRLRSLNIPLNFIVAGSVCAASGDDHSVPEPVVRQGSPTGEGAGASTCSATGALEIRDRWQDRPEDSPFWTKAFTDVIFKRKQTSPKRSGNVAFTVPCARIRKNETLAITGSGKMFGDWKKFVQLKPTDAPLWDVTLNVKEPFEYKFVILDQNDGNLGIRHESSFHRGSGQL